MSILDDYDHYDGLGLAALVRERKVSPAELVQHAIERIERLNPRLNAVIQRMYDQARDAAEGSLPAGPFRGVPFLLKDIMADVAGEPSTRACRFHQHLRPEHDSEIVRRYRDAGLILLGKTNTPEYGLICVTEPKLFGPTCNPWDLRRSPGGSSGGSAAAVAARMVPLAHGGDSGGSIRIPASCCGVFGLKPSRGRTPQGPLIGEAMQGLTCSHVLTLTVRDSAAMLDATAGPDMGAPYQAPTPNRPFAQEVEQEPGQLRIGFSAKPLLAGELHPDCLQALEQTVELCQRLGHELSEVRLPFDAGAFKRAYMTLVCGEVRADIEEAERLTGRRATHRDFEPATWCLGLLGQHLPAAQFVQATRALKTLHRQLAPLFETYDLLLTPTLAKPPVLTGSLNPNPLETLAQSLIARINSGRLIDTLVRVEALSDTYFEFTPFTPPFNATGQPAMSVPLCWTRKGLPVGMHFVGRYGDEATLLRLAGQLERAQPWFDRLPPVCY